MDVKADTKTMHGNQVTTSDALLEIDNELGIQYKTGIAEVGDAHRVFRSVRSIHSGVGLPKEFISDGTDKCGMEKASKLFVSSPMFFLFKRID